MGLKIPQKCEEQILDKVLPYFKEKDKFLDIGSSDGWYTFCAAKILPAGSEIIGFEPVPWIYEKYKNLYISSWKEEEWYKNKKIECHNKVVSNLSGELIKFYKFNGHSGVVDPALLNYSESHLSRCESWEILTTKLDDYYCEEDKNSNILVKIDVEGHEFEVVLGGEKYFSNCKNCTVFLELHRTYIENKKGNPEDVLSFFENLGYEKIKLGAHGTPGNCHLEWYIFEKRSE